MKKTLIGVALGSVLTFGVPVVLAWAALPGAVSSLSSLSAGAAPTHPAGGAGRPGQAALAIPAPMLGLYAAAALTCPGLAWSVLAAVGAVESGNGTSTLPGVHSGRNPAGAEGPMQFEPATFARYADPVPPGGADPPSPYDPVDAVYAAARLLCAAGASTPAGTGRALYTYNHSVSYVQQVLSFASAYGWTAAGTGRGLIAAEYALAQIGTPYRWGGESPARGFDCSGLAQAAWAYAGVRLPRVAQQQFDSGPFLPDGAVLEAGDLVFFGANPAAITHVGLVAAPGVMVDAPHSGAAVRIESFPASIGAPWGEELVDGMTRPGV